MKTSEKSVGDISIGELLKEAGQKCGDCPVLRSVEEKLVAMEASREERERALRIEVAGKVIDGLIAMRNDPVLSRRSRRD
ncbi:hypothetical protein A2867_01500 [Candidatus Daviesbacteria bacterium RIFCSPHIGHO2_01_FULL_40_11]|uniref:Uncharacterized protein n=1 Tax=Candidatus Daviesbacteria bacterium RIFCSPHIGHO2_01_FULL_40_11 TaxID=1797762 RepID=A0A1F5JHD8_9BACT|nr:MAG: hypothetical protein A2867_01500 [Candidatus Daviesbacteria bacterium RIFCSPHIGHO2_01_FULL_40_11]OGE62616.1 MAG: hypothetical protein A2964_02500 [Candidatus Daviesbacteria bacterium RIFCSPLOWO2_01_FULL_40_27]